MAKKTDKELEEIQKRKKAAIRKKRRAKRRRRNKIKHSRSYKIKRINFGWWHRRFNIMLDPLKPFERKILLDNSLLKYSADDDQFILILFKIYEMQRIAKAHNKQFMNPYTDNVTNIKEIRKASKQINWKCAICGTKIKSTIHNFDVDNFLCPICMETHNNSQFIDDRILQSSIKFRKACEFLYKHQQQVYQEFTRKSERSNR
jgi:rubrerythrin